MALVAYEYSDSSDFEEDSVVDNAELRVNTPSHLTLQHNPQNNSIDNLEPEDGVGSTKLFNSLPKPSKNICIEEDDDFLHKKEPQNKNKVKITVPSLSEFKDVDSTNPVSKVKKEGSKKSGLLSILPDPKFASSTRLANRNTVNSNTRPTSSTVTSKSLIPQSVAKKQDQKNNLALKGKNISLAAGSDESDNDDSESDFFSIKNKENDLLSLPAENSMPPTSFVQNFPLNQAPLVDDEEESEDVENVTNETEASASSSNSQIELDEEAIRALCGSRKRQKLDDIQIVNVDQQEVLAEARQMLMKGLMDDTTQRISASKRKGDGPSSMQKRKHQITYLAHQAKANEAELQNQWAQNRMLRRQTQSKYGF